MKRVKVPPLSKHLMYDLDLSIEVLLSGLVTCWQCSYHLVEKNK